jgi:Kdo2-lipid IVA lauroyltransferase/acyltransferase
MKSLQYILEAFVLRFFYAVLRALPLDIASAFGGFMARHIGPFLHSQNIARQNLAMAFPEKSETERNVILNAMWDHLGRVATEFPHLPKGDLPQRYTLHGTEHFPPHGTQALFFSGHIGNWEILPVFILRMVGSAMVIYRHANNPYVDKVINDLRRGFSSSLVAKGPRGAFKLAKGLKRKEAVCMLVDQKMNDGIAVPFFGRPAMTAPAIAQLALRYNLPIIPMRSIRLKGAHFEAHIYPPITAERTGDDEKDILATMTKINAMLESWIREKPEQWFWVHKRWPS